MAHKVFICHSSKDKAVADAACAALEAQRISCWIAPRDVLGGKEWAAEIIDAITTCHVVLLIFSHHANESSDVRREIAFAAGKEKIIVPFRIEDASPTGAMEYSLGNRHWLDAITPPMERRLAELCDTITRLIHLHSPSSHEPIPRQPEPPLSQQRPAPIHAPTTYASPLKPWWKRPVGLTGIAAVGLLLLILLLIPGAERLFSGPVDIIALDDKDKALLDIKDYAHALPLASKSCSLGSPKGCNNLGFLYYYGNSVPQDKPKAHRLFEQACAGDMPRACNNVALDLDFGDGITKDPRAAATYYQKACDGNWYPACTSLAQDYFWGTGIAKNPVLAQQFFQKACEGADANGCTGLGSMYATGAEGVTKDPAQSAESLQKACDLGSFHGCFNLGVSYQEANGVDQNIPHAAVLYQKSCDGGDMDGCNAMGLLYVQGKFTPPSTDSESLAQKAVVLFQKACSGNINMACYELGLDYEAGYGISPDRAKAKSLYQQSCSAGFRPACDKWNSLN